MWIFQWIVILKVDYVDWNAIQFLSFFFIFEDLRLAMWSGTGARSRVTPRLSIVTMCGCTTGKMFVLWGIAIVFTLFPPAQVSVVDTL